MAIPDIERAEEIEQIVPLVESGETLAGSELAEAERIAAEPGKEFCRRCRCCMPCQEGISVAQVMIFESLLKRLPARRAPAMGSNLLEAVAKCTGCGACKKACPYDLPIRRRIGERRDKARQIARPG